MARSDLNGNPYICPSYGPWCAGTSESAGRPGSRGTGLLSGRRLGPSVGMRNPGGVGGPALRSRPGRGSDMRIVVIGASQGTGAAAVRTALERGHAVTAFARSPEKLVLEHPKLTRMKGDFHQRASVEEAVRGQDAVILTASATQLKAFKENPNYFTQGTGLVIDAMKAHGVRKLSVLSAMGAGESQALMNVVVRTLVRSLILKLPFEDHDRQEQLVRGSGLDWVIARPGRLTDGPARGRYVTKTALEKVPFAISRADVADFLVKAVEVDTWVKHAVQLGG
ncbi:SDR family oxidoreductase [Corallococcus praedator]|uniref:SDR family oxidoreductase n=2 Tax=Myxococcaceae TaxID=31 RepID=A0ABX9Q884_9BACT|nr:SDR family oxidoreductase [Corallococcus sp. CA031C]RKH92396.1 SDR family oxidoreductase [Corallococcus praedator]